MQQITGNRLANIRQQRQGQHRIGLMLCQGDLSLPPVDIPQSQGNNVHGTQPGTRTE